MKQRCFGGTSCEGSYARYHDEEWGIPVFEDRKLFEMLILEGAQAGLSWQTVLSKREGYRRAFYHFEIKKVAEMKEGELEEILREGEVIRHRLKIFSVPHNAKVVLEIQKEFGSLSDFLWSYVGGQPIVSHFAELSEVPTSTPISTQLSKDLKKRGFKFFGPTIAYAFMQGVGMVDDHLKFCWKRGGE